MYVLGEAVLGGKVSDDITSEDVSAAAEDFLIRRILEEVTGRG